MDEEKNPQEGENKLNPSHLSNYPHGQGTVNFLLETNNPWINLEDMPFPNHMILDLANNTNKTGNYNHRLDILLRQEIANAANQRSRHASLAQILEYEEPPDSENIDRGSMKDKFYNWSYLNLLIGELRQMNVIKEGLGKRILEKVRDDSDIEYK